MSPLRGRGLAEAWPQLPAIERERFAAELGRCAAALHAMDIAPLADLPPRWDEFIAAQRDSAVRGTARAAWSRDGSSRFPPSSRPGCRRPRADGRCCTPS